MNDSTAESAQYEVICVCCGHGFPLIGASARVVTIGRTLQAGGIGFRVLHFGPSPVPLTTPNPERTGVYRGIPFEYVLATRPANVLLRYLTCALGLARLTARLIQLRSLRPRAAVYLYVMDGWLCLHVGLLCRLIGFPVVQEMCEWFPAQTDPPALTRWLYRKPIFALATGFLVISKLIESRVREKSAAVNPRLLIHRLPSIVDSQRFIAASGLNGAPTADPYFLWCGVGYTQDVLFSVRVLALVHRAGYKCKLRIITPNYLLWGPEDILTYAGGQGLPQGAIILMGRVDDRTLEACYKSAAGLLLPLWDDDKSRTRMPNKLSEYLAAGRPVVTSKVGDLCDFLTDRVNAYVAEPGSESDFADRMIAVLRDSEKANQVGAAGQQTCLLQLEYRTHADSLAKFFIDCIEYRLRSVNEGLVKYPNSEPQCLFSMERKLPTLQQAEHRQKQKHLRRRKT
jgi:glycosyltransferase involved in cell wall biosynthesis